MLSLRLVSLIFSFRWESKIIIQFIVFRGTYVPNKLDDTKKITVEVKKFVVLDILIYHADLVISHCGAGILLECLRSDHATCIAVVNDTLMGNHQSELADKLSSEGYIYQSTPSKVLKDVLRVLNDISVKGTSALKRYPEQKE